MTWKAWSLPVLVVLLSAFACRDSGDDRPPTAVPTLAPAATTSAPTQGTATVVAATPTATPSPRPTADAEGKFVAQCGDVLAPVDKQHRLPADCVPPDLVTLPAEMSSGTQQLRVDAAAAYEELFAAAQRDGFTILAASAYRSYGTQVAVHAGHVARNGQAAADRVSARPGHSEHQMGTTTDVTSASAGFGLGGFRGTPEAAWLDENSWKFGFIVSYPEGKEEVTGYVDEPWHIRWVGKDEAARVRDSGLTLHEWLLR